MPYSKAIPQQQNLARLAELLQNAKSSGNQYAVPNWVPLLGGAKAGDIFLGNAPEEIENWSYGDMPMRIPEMSNVPQFKKGRAQSLADTAMLLSAPVENTVRNAAAGNVGMIIKPKGGNWFDQYGAKPLISAMQFGRSVDPELASYAKSGMYLTPTEYGETVPKMTVNDWLEQKLAKYIQNEMATPEDPIRRIAEEWPAKRDVLINQQRAKMPDLKELAAKYEDMGLPPEVIANRLANANRDALTIQDKISDIQNYNPLHYTPKEPNEFDVDEVMTRRDLAGYPEEGLAKSELGKLWEHYADDNINIGKAHQYIREKNADKHPWLSKLNDEDPLYSPGYMQTVGFDKLATELRNAAHPDSGLPDYLRIDPAKLSRVSVPQAVEHVAKINAWREAEKLKQGFGDATFMHKNYPESGLSWMQIKMPEPTLQEGHYIGTDKRGNPAVLDEHGNVWSDASTPEEALAEYKKQDRREALQKALKFEGDTMGHCVGEYCPDVMRGDSNIYSLRDRRGEPHVTIETTKMNPAHYYENIYTNLPDDERKVLQENISEYNSKNPHLNDLEAANEYMRMIYGEAEPKIVQIKGKQNTAPNAKYLPAVQDFVRSKNWSDIGDFENTGLLRLRDYKNRLGDDLFNQALEKHGPYITLDELNKYENAAGYYANGGLVGTPPTAYDPMKVADIVASIDAPYNY